MLNAEIFATGVITRAHRQEAANSVNCPMRAGGRPGRRTNREMISLSTLIRADEVVRVTGSHPFLVKKHCQMFS
jgi:hypothetical protein